MFLGGLVQTGRISDREGDTPVAMCTVTVSVTCAFAQCEWPFKACLHQEKLSSILMSFLR